MKICVYAICKNEEKFIERWLKSADEADYICVLDTGSSDRTIELLKKNPKVILGQKIFNPFRFDVARNESMKLIPSDTDLCVCVDLDEYYDAGWRKILEEYVKATTQNVRYRYTWNFNPDGSDGVVFFANKIHTLKNFYWKNPVHEVITYAGVGEPETVTIANLHLNHKADNTKSRAQYLPLLEMSVNENPNDDRNVHYLGREYYFHQDWQKAIDMLKHHLSLKSAVWTEERCASLRYIAKCYTHLSNFEEAEKYFLLAIVECPNSREPYYDFAKYCFERSDYAKSCALFETMRNIENRNLNYISDPDCWSAKVDDYLSVCYFYLGNKNKAEKCCLNALKNFHNDKRVLKNYELIKNMKT